MIAATSDRRLLPITLGGLMLWAVCFVVLYAVLSLGCSADLDRNHLAGVNVLSALLLALWAAHLAPLAALVWLLRRRARQIDVDRSAAGAFLLRTGGAIAASGFVAMLWLALPIAVLPPCR